MYVCGSLVLLWSAGNILAQFLHTLRKIYQPELLHFVSR